MKKSLFGYKTSEVDIIIEALREENESLNSKIITLQNQIKNNIGEKNAKSILLEENIKKLERDNLKINMEKEALIDHISSFANEYEALMKKNTDLPIFNEYIYKIINELNQIITKYNSQAIKPSEYITEAAVTHNDFTNIPTNASTGE